MSYADLLNQTPPQNRTSTDRLISPVRTPKHRSSLTLSRTIASQAAFDLPPVPKTPLPRQSSARFKKSLGNTLGSQELFGSPMRRQSSGCGSDFSNPSSPRARRLPSRPSHTIYVDDIPSDFYISPMDWSKGDVIAMALTGSTVFINPKTEETTVPGNTPVDPTSVRFAQNGDDLAIGNEDGELTVYSTLRQAPVCNFGLFSSTVLCSDWYDNLIVSGSREGILGVVDVREDSPNLHENMHREEICSVRFAKDGTRIATSSNDCTVKIWDVRNIKEPVTVYEEHSAAIRAMQWSPMAHDVIVTGGGTSDKTIRLWNVDTGATICHIDTGSQVCNLLWNEEYNEILSTHGFSQNQLALWKGSDLMPIAQFHEHKQRVLYMAVSPDHTKVATAAPADNLMIWKMFPSSRLALTQTMLVVR